MEKCKESESENSEKKEKGKQATDLLPKEEECCDNATD